MKLLLIAAVAACLSVSAAERNGDVIHLNDTEKAECVADGDCVLFTKREFDAVLRAQRARVWDDARKACVFGGVGRDS